MLAKTTAPRDGESLLKWLSTTQINSIYQKEYSSPVDFCLNYLSSTYYSCNSVKSSHRRQNKSEGLHSFVKSAGLIHPAAIKAGVPLLGSYRFRATIEQNGVLAQLGKKAPTSSSKQFAHRARSSVDGLWTFTTGRPKL